MRHSKIGKGRPPQGPKGPNPPKLQKVVKDVSPNGAKPPWRPK